MKFNWITEQEIDDSLRKFLIDLEYELRPRITRFLLDRLEYECQGDFSSFSFDVDLKTQNIRLSPTTPLPYFKKISSDFDREFHYFHFQSA